MGNKTCIGIGANGEKSEKKSSRYDHLPRQGWEPLNGFLRQKLFLSRKAATGASNELQALVALTLKKIFLLVCLLIFVLEYEMIQENVEFLSRRHLMVISILR